MGAGRGKNRRLQQIVAQAGEALPCEQRGWRFFEWADTTANDEQQVSADHPYVKIVAQLEDQIVTRISSADATALADVDVCFFHGEDDRAGGCGVNTDGRLQITLQMNPERLRDAPDFFVQMVCHEYCHGLFLEAFFKVHSSDGRPDYSENNAGIVDKIEYGDTVAGEALADAFALMLHKQASINTEEGLLSYDELMATDAYDDAYSLKCFLFSLLRKQTHETSNSDFGSFVFGALAARGSRPDLGLFECLQLGVVEDKNANPDEHSFRELYEDFLVSDYAKQVLNSRT